MKIIVCGAGLVGTGIARQLATEENDVIIVDQSPEPIQKINDSLDVKAFVGHPSHPSTLEQADAEDADMIIAVTTSDETNMIVCQVAHSLFHVPIKIARIRDQNYLNPLWTDLYRQDHLPIDYIISPEMEVATDIMNRLHVPGAMNMIPLADERLKVIELRCTKHSALLNMPLEQVRDILTGVNVSMLGIEREEHFFIPGSNEKLTSGDAIYFVTGTEHVQAAMKMFGHEEKEARRVLIVGGGNIGLYVAQLLEKEDTGINAKIIEIGIKRAEEIASQLDSTTVIHGDALDQEILQEANIESTETVIAVTNDDEVNILNSLLAKRYGCQRTITLVNKSKSYFSLIYSLGIDVVVNPRETTVSSILQHIRKGKVRAAHSICSGQAEIIEIEASQNSSVIGQTITDLDLPKGIIIAAIARENEIVIPDEKETIQEGDRVVVLSTIAEIRKVDKIFSARYDYF